MLQKQRLPSVNVQFGDSAEKLFNFWICLFIRVGRRRDLQRAPVDQPETLSPPSSPAEAPGALDIPETLQRSLSSSSSVPGFHHFGNMPTIRGTGFLNTAFRRRSVEKPLPMPEQFFRQHRCVTDVTKKKNVVPQKKCQTRCESKPRSTRKTGPMPKLCPCPARGHQIRLRVKRQL